MIGDEKVAVCAAAGCAAAPMAAAATAPNAKRLRDIDGAERQVCIAMGQPQICKS
jgi:hypothetical protein